MTCARCAVLEEQVAYLRSELWLSDEGAEESRLAEGFGLSPQQARVLATLWRRGVRPTHWTLLDELTPVLAEERTLPAVWARTVICNLRRKIGWGMINTCGNLGWTLSSPGRAAVEPLLSDRARAA